LDGAKKSWKERLERCDCREFLRVEAKHLNNGNLDDLCLQGKSAGFQKKFYFHFETGDDFKYSTRV